MEKSEQEKMHECVSHLKTSLLDIVKKSAGKTGWLLVVFDVDTLSFQCSFDINYVDAPYLHPSQFFLRICVNGAESIDSLVHSILSECEQIGELAATLRVAFAAITNRNPGDKSSVAVHGETAYYVWCEGSCDNKTTNPAEALRWADEFRSDGRENVYIVDVDNNQLDELELRKLPETVNLVATGLNTDPQVIEDRVMAEYQRFVGKTVLINAVSGFVGNDSVDIKLDPPAKVRVDPTRRESVLHWNDDWLDPYWEVTLLEPHPALTDVRSLWIHGPSHHLNGKQTEASDVVQVVYDVSPDKDPSPSM